MLTADLPLTAATGEESKPAHFSGKRMIALTFVIMNLALQLTYGSFGPLVLPMTERFHAPISIVSLGMSLIVGTTGVLALAIGMILNRWSIRLVMTIGVVAISLGYVALAFSTNISQALACYGLLIGPGVAMLGYLPCFTLISRWYVQGQGRALAIISFPVLILVVPMAVTALLPKIGFDGTALALAASHLLAVPFIYALVDRPEDIGQVARGAGVLDAGRPDQSATHRLTITQLLSDPKIWATVIGIGLTMGPQIAKNVHLIPLVTERGFDLASATLLVSISGASAIIGGILFGALADRISAATTLLLAAGLQVITWFILMIANSLPLLVLDAVLMGAALGGISAPKSVMVSRIYGVGNYPLVMGLSGMCVLPFTFGMPPIVGVLREITGNYILPVVVQIAGLCIAGLCFLWLRRRELELRSVA